MRARRKDTWKKSTGGKGLQTSHKRRVHAHMQTRKHCKETRHTTPSPPVPRSSRKKKKWFFDEKGDKMIYKNTIKRLHKPSNAGRRSLGLKKTTHFFHGSSQSSDDGDDDPTKNKTLSFPPSFFRVSGLLLSQETNENRGWWPKSKVRRRLRPAGSSFLRGQPPSPPGTLQPRGRPRRPLPRTVAPLRPGALRPPPV